MQKQYLVKQTDLNALVRYEILFKWKQWQEEMASNNKSFGDYLLEDTPYQPNHEFIQSLCKTKEEKADPINYKIYEDILPSDLARYQVSKFYTPFMGDK